MGSVAVHDPPADLSRYSHTMVGDTHARADRQTPSSAHSTGSFANSAAVSHNAQHLAAAHARAASTGDATSAGRAGSHNRHMDTSPDAAETTEQGRAQLSEHEAGTSQPSTRDSASSTQVEHSEGEGFDRSGFPLNSAPRGLAAAPPSPQLLPTIRSSLSFVKSRDVSPSRTTKIHNLAQIHSFASEDASTNSRPGSGPRPATLHSDESQQFEISEMPVTEIIEMVAGLLTKITTTNDRQRQHESVHQHLPSPDGSTALNRQTASVLAFHGKNVPSITILSYLSRIHKYCPTTYEVFLSLLIYFDRMMEIVNEGTLASFRSAAQSAEREILSPSSTTTLQAEALRATSSTSQHTPQAESLASGMATPPSSGSAKPRDVPGSSPSTAGTSEVDEESGKLSHCFIVDSFNIHRLVIAGVTCASKFFSDVFYTNSRYAKVRVSLSSLLL